MTPVSRVAEFVVRANVDEPTSRVACAIVENAIRAVSRCSGGNAAAKLVEVMHIAGAPRLARPVGTTHALGVAQAAFVTATAGGLCRSKAVDQLAIAEVDLVVVAAALAVADWKDGPASLLLEAVACGAEIGARMWRSMGDATQAGWVAASTAGQVAATAATCRMLRLGESAVVNAIGLAATQACGLRSAVGTDAYAIQVGKAAAIAVEAGELASRGFSGPALMVGRPIQRSTDWDIDSVADGLGKRWLVIERQSELPHAIYDDEYARLCARLQQGLAPRLLLDALPGVAKQVPSRQDNLIG
jgi:hypothetical protein